MGNSHKNLLVWNLWVAQLEPNFDKIAIGWSSSKIVSGGPALWPRWLQQCSYVVIESSFDPGERLQAPGSLWFCKYFLLTDLYRFNIIWEKYLLKIFCSETWDEMIFDPRWMLLLLAEISNGKKKRIGWNFSM